MSVHIKAYRCDGTTRAIWSGPHAANNRRHRVLPVRGSLVIAIAEGPQAGYFHVDFSPLADVTKNDRYRVCLVETFETHEQAVEAERQWLLENWVLAP